MSGNLGRARIAREMYTFKIILPEPSGERWASGQVKEGCLSVCVCVLFFYLSQVVVIRVRMDFTVHKVYFFADKPSESKSIV